MLLQWAHHLDPQCANFRLSHFASQLPADNSDEILLLLYMFFPLMITLAGLQSGTSYSGKLNDVVTNLWFTLEIEPSICACVSGHLYFFCHPHIKKVMVKVQVYSLDQIKTALPTSQRFRKLTYTGLMLNYMS